MVVHIDLTLHAGFGSVLYVAMLSRVSKKARPSR